MSKNKSRCKRNFCNNCNLVDVSLQLLTHLFSWRAKAEEGETNINKKVTAF